MISETSTDDVKTKLIETPLLRLKLMTPFGLVSVKVHVKTTEHVPESNMMEETVSSIVEKSILRCLMVSSLQEGSDNNAEQDQLAKTVEKLVHMLSNEDVETYETLKQGSTTQQESVQKIKSLSEHIVQLCTIEKKTLTNRMMSYMSYLSYILPLHFSIIASLLVFEGNMETDYHDQLSHTCDKVLRSSAFHAQTDPVIEDLQEKLNQEEQQDNEEIQMMTEGTIAIIFRTKIRKLISHKRKTKKIFLKESILSCLYEATGGETSKLTEKIPTSARKFYEQKVECFLAIHELRFVFSKQCFIGFVGPQNAGKSTLLNALFNKRVETGMTTHTDEATKYSVAENIFAVDFPGSDSLFSHKERFSQFGRINNFFVYVMPYTGTPSEALVKNVKMAYEMEMYAGKSAKTLFCINKATREDVMFDEEYKTKFVQMIKDYIRENDFNEEESLMKKWSAGITNKVAQTVSNEAYEEIKAKYKELKEYTIKNLTTDDFIFTDWKQHDTNRGIKGPEDVRKRIKSYLVEARVRSEDNLDDI
jgi:energy-coupling factor transporter ATP-binding protein EcfA2